MTDQQQKSAPQYKSCETQRQDYSKDTIFSFFKAPASNCKPDRSVSLDDIVGYITSTEAKARTEKLRTITDAAAARKYKQSAFDHCTFAGSFSYRSNDNLLQDSGLVCLDFDHVQDLERLWSDLIADSYLDIRLQFHSPSGNGIKCVVFTDRQKGTYSQRYDALIRHCKEILSADVDTSGRDICRTCYLPYDPAAYVADFDGDGCDLDQWLQPEPDHKEPDCKTAAYDLTDKQRQKIAQDVETVVKRIEAAAVDITLIQRDWVTIGFTFADFFGEAGRNLFHRVSQFYSNPETGSSYSYEETSKQYDCCLKANKQDRQRRASIRSFFQIASQSGIDVVSGCNYFTTDPFEDFNDNNLTAMPEEIQTKQQLLAALLKQISEENINIRDKAGLKDPDDKLTQKTALVISIDEILKIAKKNNWGLALSDSYIYVYNGNYWQAMTAEDLKPFLSRAIIKMGYKDLEARYYKFQNELYLQFESAAQLPALERDPARTLINLKNGTFEIADGKDPVLRPADRRDFLKYQLPFSYDPEATCPIFDKFLNDVLPDKSCQTVLAEYIGYIFTSLNLQKVAVLYGTGANGKSVFFDIVTALLGSVNTSSFSLQNLTKYDSYQRAELSTKLLNYASEISGKLETSIFKQLACGEPVEARQIWGKPFIMRNYAKLMFNCNELPRDVELTDAFFRRFLIIPFTQTIPESKQDPDLAQKIISSELSGVFNWALAGLKRIQKNRKFSRSEIIDNELRIYRKESDSVAVFVDDYGIVPDSSKTVRLSELFQRYTEYCYSNGYNRVSSKTLIKRLRALNFQTIKQASGQTVFCTISQIL